MSRRLLGTVIAVVGALLLLDAALAVTWREPVSWALARGDQERLSRQLDARAAPVRAGLLATNGGHRETAAHRFHLRIARAAQTLRAITPTGDPLGRISIPRLRASFVFVQGTDSAALRGGPGHYMPTALPGEHGTVGLAGHRTTYLQPFRHIDRLRAGDRITLTMPYGRFSYVVSGSRVVAPSELSVLARTPGVDRLVLTACHPLFSAAQRLVVTARLASTSA